MRIIILLGFVFFRSPRWAHRGNLLFQMKRSRVFRQSFVMCLERGGDGSVYAGTEGNGLWFFKKDKQFSQLLKPVSFLAKTK